MGYTRARPSRRADTHVRICTAMGNYRPSLLVPSPVIVRSLHRTLILRLRGTARPAIVHRLVPHLPLVSLPTVRPWVLVPLPSLSAPLPTPTPIPELPTSAASPFPCLSSLVRHHLSSYPFTSFRPNLVPSSSSVLSRHPVRFFHDLPRSPHRENVHPQLPSSCVPLSCLRHSRPSLRCPGR